MTMIPRCLPPVGLPVLRAAGAAVPVFAGYRPVWVQRGAAALALAVQLAMGRRPGVGRARVLIPGYGCPDLVAAVLYAGAEPVLVDVGADDPGFDPQALERAWTAEVVAVVAANCLGIAERLASLAEMARARDAWLIEDDAQWYPEPVPGTPMLAGDAVVLSFGRGKPVSLLGGGALLLRENQWGQTRLISDSESRRDLSPSIQRGPIQRGLTRLNLLALELKAALYNRLLDPRWYGLVARNPLLSVGESRYTALDGVTGMDLRRLAWLGANVHAWLQRDRWREAAISKALADCAVVSVDLPRALADRARRLLRYPVLCRDRAIRDRLLTRLEAAGLGATAMYREVLPRVPGVAAVLGPVPDLPGASAFAERLLTLPVHDSVTAADIQRMAAVMEEVA